jgi:hypothetical protein
VHDRRNAKAQGRRLQTEQAYQATGRQPSAFFIELPKQVLKFYWRLEAWKHSAFEHWAPAALPLMTR